jgi:hypothetical protein
MTEPGSADNGSMEDLVHALNQESDTAPLVPEASELAHVPAPDTQPQGEFDLEKALDDVMTRFEETLDYLAH